jgi:hypothetical protein
VAAEKRRQGKPEPRAIRERPSIQQEHEELWIAFAELDGARQIGFGGRVLVPHAWRRRVAPRDVLAGDPAARSRDARTGQQAETA